MNIDQETMKAAVAKAILDSLGENGRALVVQQAVQALLVDVPKRDSFDRRPAKNHLQEMFDEEVRRQSAQIVRDMLHENAEFKEQVQVLVREAVTKVFAGERLAQKLADLIENAIGRVHLSRED